MDRKRCNIAFGSSESFPYQKYLGVLKRDSQVPPSSSGAEAGNTGEILGFGAVTETDLLEINH